MTGAQSSRMREVRVEALASHVGKHLVYTLPSQLHTHTHMHTCVHAHTDLHAPSASKFFFVVEIIKFNRHLQLQHFLDIDIKRYEI